MRLALHFQYQSHLAKTLFNPLNSSDIIFMLVVPSFGVIHFILFSKYHILPNFFEVELHGPPYSANCVLSMDVTMPFTADMTTVVAINPSLSLIACTYFEPASYLAFPLGFVSNAFTGDWLPLSANFIDNSSS